MRASLFTSTVAFAASVGALETLVDLGYAKYQGATLGNGVNQWLGLRFAAPSVPPRRFAEAQPPLPETAVQDATREGALCLSANNQEGLQFNSPRQPMAEDCLFAAVYAPANATEASNLPILMFISGGGFSSNSNGNFNGTGLVEASGMNMVVVRANYRVGILGFIAGTMIEADTKGAASNNGLKDMVAAARWVKQYATKFGGNPNHIVVSGASSGGNAIDELLAANNGTGFPDLFVGAIAESTGWGAEGFTVDRDSALKANIAATGCSATPDPIDCMRNMPIAEFQNKTTRDGWGPTVDGKFITAAHYQMYEQGRFQNIPVIYGYASDEGTPDFIANQTVNTTEQVAGHFRSKIGASMTDAEVAMVVAAYPESLSNVSFFGRDVSGAGRNASLRQGSGAQWQRDAAIQTELKLHCVGAFFADMFAAAGQAATFQYRYNILDEAPGGNADKGLFSPHTSELYAVWGRNNTDGGDPGCLRLDAADPKSCVAGARMTQAYFISFVRTLDPNALRMPGAPEWTAWTIAQPNRIVLDNAGAAMEVMGAAVGETPLNGMTQRQRCVGLTLDFAKRINLNLGANATLPPFANGTRQDPTLAHALPTMMAPPAGNQTAGRPGAPVGGNTTTAGAPAPATGGGETIIIIIEGGGTAAVPAPPPPPGAPAPGQPGTPPKGPGTPEAPGAPKSPGDPKAPASPGMPGNPKSPGPPESPGAPKSSPGGPKPSDAPKAPASPQGAAGNISAAPAVPATANLPPANDTASSRARPGIGQAPLNGTLNSTRPLVGQSDAASPVPSLRTLIGTGFMGFMLLAMG